MNVVKLSKKHKENIIKVNLLRELIVKNKNNSNERVFSDIHTLLTDVHVRDGLLHQFSTLDFIGRSALLDEITEYTIAISEDTDPSTKLGDVVGINAAFLYLHMGLNIKQNTVLTDHSKNLDNLLDSAAKLGSTLNLLSLIKTARNYGIPDTVFSDSVTCLSFEHTTAPVEEAHLFVTEGK